MKKPKQQVKSGSVMLRTWIYFVIMTVIIFALFWVTETILFNTYSRSMKEEGIKRECNNLINSFSGEVSPTYMSEVERSVVVHSMHFSIFTVDCALSEAEDDNVNLIVNADMFDGHAPSTEARARALSVILDDRYFDSIQSGSGNFRMRLPMIDAGDDVYTFVFSGKSEIEGTVYYFCAFAPVTSINNTSNMIIGQMITVSVITLIFSIMVSYVFARNITKPISEYAETARRMGKGEKVVFEEVGLDEYDELARALNHSNSELEKTEKMRKDFLANVSHDLRTPLTMVKAYAEMIRDISGKNEKKRVEHCEVIIDEVDRLTLLVNDILDLSKIQSGTRKPEKKKVDVSAVVNEVIKRFTIYEKDGYAFSVDIEKDCFVVTDERMLEQICYNLIGNSINYTGDDKKVSVKVINKENSVRVEVTDTGKGIAPAERDSVWERYYRASQAKRTAIGTGLGLSIVKNLYEVLDATYGIDSALNLGSTFWFELSKEE